MSKRNYVNSLLFIALLAIFIGGIYMVVKHNKQKEKERRLEARFDRFMGYFYPYLDDISVAAEMYKRMKLSMMYDYILNHKGRYVNETVNYYDGGSFLVRDKFLLEQFLNQTIMLGMSRASRVLESPPPSRYKERLAFRRILNAAQELKDLDIYYISSFEEVEQTKEFADSLNLEIQNNIRSLVNYKSTSMKKDLNNISEEDYELIFY